MTTAILTETALDLPLDARGKVRDIYDLGDKLLIVATDRISAFDVVLPTGIPDKGLVLTQLSAFWFEKTGDIVPNHFIRIVDSTRMEDVPVELPRELIGRAMVVHKAQRLEGGGGAVGADLHPHYEGGRGPRREHHVRAGGATSRRAGGERHGAALARSVPLRAGVRPRAGDHNRRHEVRVRLAQRRGDPDRRGADAR